MGNGELLFDALGEGCLQHGRYTLPFSFIHGGLRRDPGRSLYVDGNKKIIAGLEEGGH